MRRGARCSGAARWVAAARRRQSARCRCSGRRAVQHSRRSPWPPMGKAGCRLPLPSVTVVYCAVRDKGTATARLARGVELTGPAPSRPARPAGARLELYQPRSAGMRGGRCAAVHVLTNCRMPLPLPSWRWHKSCILIKAVYRCVVANDWTESLCGEDEAKRVSPDPVSRSGTARGPSMVFDGPPTPPSPPLSVWACAHGHSAAGPGLLVCGEVEAQLINYTPCQTAGKDSSSSAWTGRSASRARGR